jgi:hypothetical protein
LAVSVLPRDSDIVIQFNNGKATLGEVDEWLKSYTRSQSWWAKAGVIIGGVSLVIAVISLLVAVAALEHDPRPNTPAAAVK